MADTESLDLFDDETLQQNIADRTKRTGNMRKDWKKNAVRREIESGNRKPSLIKRMLSGVLHLPLFIGKWAVLAAVIHAIIYLSTGFGMPGVTDERAELKKEINALEQTMNIQRERMDTIDFEPLRSGAPESERNSTYREYASLTVEHSDNEEKLMKLQDAYNGMLGMDDTYDERINVLLNFYRTFFGFEEIEVDEEADDVDVNEISDETAS